MTESETPRASLAQELVSEWAKEHDLFVLQSWIFANFDILKTLKLKRLVFLILLLIIFLSLGNFLVLLRFLGTAKKKILKKDSSKNEKIFGKNISKNKLKSKKKKKKKKKK